MLTKLDSLGSTVMCETLEGIVVFFTISTVRKLTKLSICKIAFCFYFKFYYPINTNRTNLSEITRFLSINFQNFEVGRISALHPAFE